MSIKKIRLFIRKDLSSKGFGGFLKINFTCPINLWDRPPASLEPWESILANPYKMEL
jgi:hypothetical protein